MKSIIAIGISLIAVIIVYILGLINCPILFVLFLPVALLVLFATILLLTTNLIWHLAPKNIKNIYQTHKIRFKATIMASLIFLFISGWLINHFYLPQTLHPITILCNVAILAFTIFLAWCLLKPKKKGTLIIGTLLFVSFIFFITALSTIIPENTGSAPINTLKSLPYVDWVPAEETIEKLGVTKYNQKLSHEGLNLFCLRPTAEAYLMDMQGNILHKWSTKLIDPTGNPISWQDVKMCENGDLLCGAYRGLFIRLDWNSNIKWLRKMSFHHEITTTENNDIYVMDTKFEMAFSHALPLPILNDYILVLFPDGQTKKEINLFKVLKKEIPSYAVTEIYLHIMNPKNLYNLVYTKLIKKKSQYLFSLLDSSPFDILHSNAITIINRDINGLCKKEDLLISARKLDLIGIIDVKKERLIWSWGPGDLSKQHQPTLLENGNILIYDNGFVKKFSRLIELDPITKKIVWEYKANPLIQFYSSVGGGCQRLPNGNTLITEEYKGRAFEVTKDGQIAWEFYFPFTKERKRTVMYRMIRITDPENYPILKELKTSNR